MKSIREEIIKGLQHRYNTVSETTLSYLERDGWLHNHSEFSIFLEGVRKCFEFANQKNLKLGTARGSAPASLSLYSLGFSGVDPMNYEMTPERLSDQIPYFHIDVEYDRGQEFVDFCQEINRTLTYGEIQAFKMPLIDIVQGVDTTLGKKIDYVALALEFFFGYEALALVEKARGNTVGFTLAYEQAKANFEKLSVDNKSWCLSILSNLKI